MRSAAFSRLSLADAEPIPHLVTSDRFPKTRAVLTSDADDAMRRGTRAYLLLIDRHRAISYPLVTAGAAGVFLLLWRSFSLEVASVVVGLCLVYGVALGVVVAVRQRRLRGGP